MTKLEKIVMWGAIAILAIGVVVGLAKGVATNTVTTNTDENVGSAAVQVIPQWFTNGLKMGTYDATRTWGALSVGRGQNQASWRNTTGKDVFVDYASIYQAGTSSSTVKVYLATSTTATISNDYTAPWAQLVDGWQFATSSANAVGDNINSHKTAYAGTLRVTNGQYLVVQAQEAYGCKAVGACETATSTNRGWTTLSVPFSYRY